MRKEHTQPKASHTRRNGSTHSSSKDRAHHVSPALILIGGREDKEGDKIILCEVARRVGSGKLVVTTVASHDPGDLFEKYEGIFRSLGVKHVEKLEIESRDEARKPETVAKIADAAGIFFTGGDQLRITSQIGDTPTFEMLRELHQRGAVIAGTSAGASVVCETMLVAGEGRESHRIDESLKMAPGLGLVPGMIVDQHFAERGRLGRLLGAVAHNPAMLGIGIDEDTAIVIEGNHFTVLGSGAIYVIDAREMSYSNIADATVGQTLSVHHLILHTLVHGERYELHERRPSQAPEAVASEAPARGSDT
jgi:cyanophycinase